MIRTLILLLALTLILLGVGFLVGGVFGMTIALFLAFFLNFLSYWYSDSIILRVYRAHQTEDEGLKEIVKKLASDAGIPVPKIYVIPSDVPNAFATGRNPEHGAVAVTQGLTSLSKDEMEAVIAHEMTHIKNRDTLIQTLAATIAGAISYLAMIGYWSLFMSDRRDSGSLIIGVILIAIFAPLAATLVRLAISRRREYAADHGAALMTKKPMSLASALRKITDATQHRKIHGSSATSHLWIVNPFKQDWFTGLFSTHPPVKRRIAKLERLAARRGDEDDR
jgi:heat shock protein HtpX